MISKLSMSLINVGNEVDFNNKQFGMYIKNNPRCKIAISNVLTDIKRKKKFRKGDFLKLRESHPNQTGYFFPSWQGKLGEGPKLLFLAGAFKASEVHFVGIDGHTEEEMKKRISGNVFEPGKKLAVKFFDWDMQRIQFVYMFDLLTKIFPNIVWKNLGSRYCNNQIKFIDQYGNLSP